jgi:hypothetical protein
VAGRCKSGCSENFSVQARCALQRSIAQQKRFPKTDCFPGCRSTEGANQGKTYPAIYELKGDTLRICDDLSGAKRPSEFKTVEGTRLYLVTYDRKKE